MMTIILILRDFENFLLNALFRRISNIANTLLELPCKLKVYSVKFLAHDESAIFSTKAANTFVGC